MRKKDTLEFGTEFFIIVAIEGMLVYGSDWKDKMSLCPSSCRDFTPVLFLEGVMRMYLLASSYLCGMIN